MFHDLRAPFHSTIWCQIEMTIYICTSMITWIEKVLFSRLNLVELMRLWMLCFMLYHQVMFIDINQTLEVRLCYDSKLYLSVISESKHWFLNTVFGNLVPVHLLHLPTKVIPHFPIGMFTNHDNSELLFTA